MKRIKLLILFVLIAEASYAQKFNVEVNLKSKALSIDTIQINAPVDKVYNLIANINDWPKWFDGVTETTMEGQASEGKVFVWKAKGYKIKSKIHTVRQYSEIGWTGKMWWIGAIHNWHFEPTPNGNTIVIVQECFTGFCSSLMKNSLKSDMRHDLVVLKKEAEK